MKIKQVKQYFGLGMLLTLTPLLSTAEELKDPQPPSFELLEFLSTWDDGDGNWIDPIELAEIQQRSHDEIKKEVKPNEQ